MERKAILISSVLALVLTVSFFHFSGNSYEKENLNFNSTNFNGSSDNVRRTDSGTKYIVNPDKLIQGCPGKDCIPSIDNPNYVKPKKADWLKPSYRVIGVEGETESLAFPIRILSRHEIVNTEIDSKPIVVTYCPLCRSGVTYSRKVKGDVLEFGVSGKLLKANLVMYDRSTETYWSQIKGKAIIGPRVPQKLKLIHSSITNWSKWKQGHPNTKVLSINTGIYPPSTYKSESYTFYKSSDRVGFGVRNVDNRLNAKEVVYGISLNNSSKAYPESKIRREKIIQDKVGNIPIVIFENPVDGSITAYKRQKNGKILNLSLKNSKLVSNTGESWSLKNGEIEELDRIFTKGFYWFAWSKFNPNTGVYQN